VKKRFGSGGIDHRLGRKLAQLQSKRLERHDIERFANDELAHLVILEDFGEQVADVQDFTESLEHLDEPAVLALGEIGVHDVVIEKIRASTRRDSEKLVAGAVD